MLILQIRIDIPKLAPFFSWPGAMINPDKFEFLIVKSKAKAESPL